MLSLNCDKYLEYNIEATWSSCDALYKLQEKMQTKAAGCLVQFCDLSTVEDEEWKGQIRSYKFSIVFEVAVYDWFFCWKNGRPRVHQLAGFDISLIYIYIYTHTHILTRCASEASFFSSMPITR